MTIDSSYNAVYIKSKWIKTWHHSCIINLLKNYLITPHLITLHSTAPSLVVFPWPHATVCLIPYLCLTSSCFLCFHRWFRRCPGSLTTASLRSKASGKFPFCPAPFHVLALLSSSPGWCHSFPALGSGAFSNESFKMVSGSRSSMWAQAVGRLRLCSEPMRPSGTRQPLFVCLYVHRLHK